MYGNFQDPVGLVRRMLASGDPAARSALAYAGWRLLLTPADGLLAAIERRTVQNVAPSSLPLVLVVGGPRSGTTLVYQALCRCLPTTYFTNLSSLFPRSPLTATRLFGRYVKARRTAHAFRSYYGQTAGLGAPNDGFHVWDRWLGSDRFETKQNLTTTDQLEIQAFFNAWLNTFGCPFVNKNNRNTSAVPCLAAALENAVFLVVDRDPIHVASSLIVARRRVQGDARIGWGLCSRNVKSGDRTLAHVDAVCDQLEAVARHLQVARERVSADRLLEVSYEDFCRAPTSTLQRVAERIFGRTDLLHDAPQSFEPVTTHEISSEELTRVRERLT